jgi:hypothetical protein
MKVTCERFFVFRNQRTKKSNKIIEIINIYKVGMVDKRVLEAISDELNKFSGIELPWICSSLPLDSV